MPHTNNDLINMFLVHQQGRSFSEYTIRRRRVSLGSLARWVHPMSFDQVDVSMIEEWVATFNAPRTRHAYLSDASSFFGWALKRKLVESNPAADADAIRVPKGLPRPVPVNAIRHIIATAPGRELRTGLALAAYAGLRRSEIVTLQTDDVSMFADPPILAVRGGKGGKDRLVPVHPLLALHLGHPRAQGRFVQMTPDTFGRLAAQHIRACGLNYTAHSLRATFATELARITHGNVLLVGKMLGHESMQTTSAYIGLAGYAGIEAVARMYVDVA